MVAIIIKSNIISLMEEENKKTKKLSLQQLNITRREMDIYIDYARREVIQTDPEQGSERKQAVLRLNLLLAIAQAEYPDYKVTLEPVTLAILQHSSKGFKDKRYYNGRFHSDSKHVSEFKGKA